MFELDKKSSLRFSGFIALGIQHLLLKLGLNTAVKALKKLKAARAGKYLRDFMRKKPSSLCSSPRTFTPPPLAQPFVSVVREEDSVESLESDGLLMDVDSTVGSSDSVN